MIAINFTKFKQPNEQYQSRSCFENNCDLDTDNIVIGFEKINICSTNKENTYDVPINKVIVWRM